MAAENAGVTVTCVELVKVVISDATVPILMIRPTSEAWKAVPVPLTMLSDPVWTSTVPGTRFLI